MTHFLSHTNDLSGKPVKPLSQFDSKQSLVKGDNISLVSNICPHQLSLICSKRSKELKCQYHGWEWDLNGNPIGSGKTKCANDVPLKSTEVYNDNGLLFSTELKIQELKNLGIEDLFLDAERVDIVNCNWKNIVDVFLDVDHIPEVHKGVYDAIGLDENATIDWSYYDWGSVQTVKDKQEKTIAVWATVYPYTMIEWQAGSLFVTVCNPKEDKTKVSVFKYMSRSTEHYKNNMIFERAWTQDKHQAESIVSFPQKNLEEQKLHFRNWLADSSNGLS